MNLVMRMEYLILQSYRFPNLLLLQLIRVQLNIIEYIFLLVIILNIIIANMGNLTDICNPGNAQQTLTQNSNKIFNNILNDRRQLKQLPPLPTPIQQKIVSLLKLNNMQQLYQNSKIWKVKKPYKFCYINQPLCKDSIPFGICSIFSYTDKNQFIGFFKGQVNKNGMRENKGSLYVYANGDYFIGDQNKTDYGTYFDQQNQYKYQGDWVNGRPHGVGKQTTKKGIYEGYFLNGKKQGQGKYQFPDGSVYQGNFKNNQIQGQGTLTNAKQEYQYVGQFLGGSKHGYGKQKTKFYLYDGEFNRNKKQGIGKLIANNDKNQYEGYFQNDTLHGKGRLKQNGQYLQGIWHNGQINTVVNIGK